MQQQAECYLGAAIEPQEWGKAKAFAERKLNGIIEREGDCGGERREPYYLAQLIAETVRSDRFSQFTLDLIELDRYLDEQLEIKKRQPVS